MTEPEAKEAQAREEVKLSFGGLGQLGVAGAFGTLPIIALVLGWSRLLGLEDPPQGMLWCVAVCVAVPGLVLWLRQPRGARITWDSWGVTEWDGAAPRAAIPWSRAHVWSEGDKAVQITDGAGTRIMAARVLEDDAARCRRRAAGDVGPLVAAVRARAAGETSPVPWAELDPHRPGRFDLLKWIGAVFGYPALTLGAGTIFESGEVGEITLPSLIVGVVGLSLRAVRPCRELLSRLRALPRLRGALRVTFVESSGTLVTARDRSGRECRFDMAGLPHQDGRLAERRGLARVVFEELVPVEADSPYRGAAAVSTVQAVELDLVRRARRRLLAALGLELAVRLGLAAAGLAMILYIV